MPIDFSKFSQEELDQIIKEEALRRRAEMLSESKKKARINQLLEAKKALETELKTLSEDMDMEEGLLSKLGFGGGGDDKRKQTVITLLSHPVKGRELLKYASDEQIAQFKQYMPQKTQAIDNFIKGGNRKVIDANRVESFIKVNMDGAKSVRFDPATSTYSDTTQLRGANPGSAFAEGGEPQA